ncbi:hypothetical protein VOLCADRAFT_89787 [Volvox carteri f. nagariensis]|uniref:Uncharacterized protein n=1 Tax=Volvox carteri f. nagariensis TaxID=3068 RepID=D8TSM7_VOLCA|nr:uncharacterized protein VOLCADRAFT_89787 [Volvox carteri f. nagariensis]EFJ49397.1 hypothetical protein VOLCADRAFT_89787 [Volvox carteri f. nagariensis]|eukprot:XP_002949378.1 hypothetical protein VOLCADRAFT_89787 [Volvox carteri f. nagariensis]
MMPTSSQQTVSGVVWPTVVGLPGRNKTLRQQSDSTERIIDSWPNCRRPGNSFEAQRTGSSRKSLEVPCSPGSRKSVEVTLSPTGSLNKANSLLRGPGNAADGTIGSEGWWHHMDHSQMNMSPTDDSTSKSQTKATGGSALPYSSVTRKQSLWADEEPAAAAAPPLPAAASALKPEEPTFKLAEAPAPTPAAPGASSVPAGSSNTTDNVGGPLQSGAGSGWWTRMDNSPLNQPPETKPLTDGAAVRKGERVMGGGFTPQFHIAGSGGRYGSIFAEESVQPAADQQSGDPSRPLAQQVADWGPFCGQQPSSTAAAGSAFGGGGGAEGEEEDCWTSFASAPKA